MKRTCSVDGCHEKHEALGFCHSHYKRYKLHGNPLVVKQQKRGSTWYEKGYPVRTENGKSQKEHRRIAEQVLGHTLPKGACVHHVDEDKRNNKNSNLVICQSYGYHRIIHMKMDSLKATGNPKWRRCPYCKKYDDPTNMRDEKVRFVHPYCRKLFDKRRENNGIHI